MPDLSAFRAALAAEEEYAPAAAQVAAEVTERLRRQQRHRRRSSLLAVAAAVAVLAGGTTLLHGEPSAPYAPPAVVAPADTAIAPSTAPNSTTQQTTTPPFAQRQIAVSAQVFGQANLSPIAPVVVSVANGRIITVAVTTTGGKSLTGRLSADGSTWTLVDAMTYATRYDVTGTAVGLDGRHVAISGSFGTLTPGSQAEVALSPQTGTTAGVGVPISLMFPAGLTRAARTVLQKRLTVVTSVPVEGSWGWFERDGAWVADWRPKQFWPQNISVRVSAHLFGVELAPGVYGAADLQSDFRIGRNQLVTVDGAGNRLVITRNGATVATYPASVAGWKLSEVIPAGTYVVQEKSERRVSSTPSGQSSVTNWVVRLSNSGQFIGAAATTTDQQGGSVAGQDGGVNLSNVDAKAYFDTALSGDPVTVINAGTNASAGDTGSDWSIPWVDWQKLSG